MDQAPSISHHEPKNGLQESTRKRRHRWIWAVILLLFGLLFYWVLHQHNASQQRGGRAGRAGGRFGVAGAVPVTTATAHYGDLGVYLDTIGTVTPVYTDSVTAQVTGVITAVHYKEGQTVHKGDPLIDIDDRPYAAQLVQAEGALERDQSILAEAQMDLKRYQDAWKKNAIPRQTLEDQEKQVFIDEGTVKNDQGLVQFDKVQVLYCHIASPIDGRVGLRLVDPGNLVTANSTNVLVVITQMQPITVIFPLSEDDLSEVLEESHTGRPMPVQVFDRTQQNFLAAGKLMTVDNQIDTTTGTVKLRALFSNAKGVLFPNQFVNARLLVKTLKHQLLLPSSAVQHNGGTSFVYLLQGNKAVMRTVKPGITQGGDIVVEGLQPGDEVADSSFEKLQNGTQVFRTKFTLPGASGAESGVSAP
jgi:multidrug efflux system membrane fusion protein